MREIREFEMEHDEPATAWRIVRPLVVMVTTGQLWLTLEHDAEDYWLEAGQSFVLPAGARAWVSAGRDGARVNVTSANSVSIGSAGVGVGTTSRQSVAADARGWMTRLLRVA
jgi:quercetin dioxygenase-like cupin family protein